MTEVELKLQVPPAALAALARALAGEGAASTRLQAIYFDTPDGRLAAAGLALRLRKEGRRWLQTLKAGSAHGLERAEHEVTLVLPAGGEPALDLERHHDTPAGAALARALADADAASPLLPRYRTDIRRRHRLLRSRRGTVELALDQGRISAAQPDGGELHWPVCELEVELASGSRQAVIDVARRLALRHALWIDMRSKAERGDRLARGVAAGVAVDAVKAKPLQLAPAMTARQAWATLLQELLAHALPNWSELAGPGATPAPDAVHQLRVALRRLRSAQRLFEGWPGVQALALSEPAAALFRALGASRDREVLASGLQPDIDAALAAQGQPPLALPPAADVPAWTDAERATHGLLFIDLLGETAADLEPAAPDDLSLTQLFAARLEHWHRQARRDAKRFGELDDAARHRLRKRLKRLRYAIEFGAELFGKRKVGRYLERMRAAQEQLGQFSDLCVAQAAYAALLPQEPRAWFALGWLQARRAAVLADCAEALRGLRRAKPFWPE